MPCITNVVNANELHCLARRSIVSVAFHDATYVLRRRSERGNCKELVSTLTVIIVTPVAGILPVITHCNFTALCSVRE